MKERIEWDTSTRPQEGEEEPRIKKKEKKIEGNSCIPRKRKEERKREILASVERKD